LRPSGSLVLITVALGLLLDPPYSIGQQQPAEPHPLPTLTSAHDAHSLTLEQAGHNYPVHLRTVVTYYDSSVDPRNPTFFVSDSSGAIFVEPSSLPAIPFQAGDLVEITGVSAAGSYSPVVKTGSVQLIGKSLLPATAPRVTMTALLSGSEDGQWVEIEGVVHAAWRTGKNVNLELALSDGAITATTLEEAGADYDSLVEVLNKTELLSRLDGDAQLLRELIEIFLAGSPSLLQQVSDAVTSRDPLDLKRAAHKLSGTVSIFGSQPVMRTAVMLEAMGGDRAQAGEVLTQLKDQMKELEAALGEMMQETCPSA
jgi:HPt (histidine-containing phosphotransfer) domain-containing protein